MQDVHGDAVSPPCCPPHPAAWLRSHSAVWLSRQHVTYRAPRARPAPTATAIATLADVLNAAGLALSALWSADGHRADPLGAPAGRRHTRLRHLMSPSRPRNDGHLHQRGQTRVRTRVSRTQKPAPARAS